MKKILLVMAVGICATGLTFSAGATSYQLDFTAGGVTADGTIDITGGMMTGGSVTVNGAAKDGTFTFASPPTVRALDGTDINFDNVVNLASTPMLTSGGLGFGLDFSDAQHAQYVLNIWGNGDGSYSLFEAGQLPSIPDTDAIVQGHVYNEYDGGSLSLTASVPDTGSTATLLGIGLFGIGYVAHKKKSVRMPASAAQTA